MQVQVKQGEAEISKTVKLIYCYMHQH